MNCSLMNLHSFLDGLDSWNLLGVFGKLFVLCLDLVSLYLYFDELVLLHIHGVSN